MSKRLDFGLLNTLFRFLGQPKLRFGRRSFSFWGFGGVGGDGGGVGWVKVDNGGSSMRWSGDRGG